MKHVFLYARVSTEEQAVHGLSIDAQVTALEAWAKDNGHKIVGTYIDAGISARKPATKRPELQRLLADARAGKGDLIVFTKLDRWFRNIAEYYKVQEVLEKHHVDWRTIHEDYDTSTASGRLKINIMLSVAQDEADRTSERIKAVFEAKRQKGEPLTGQMPYGYVLDKAQKKIVKDPETQQAVETFFRSFLASGSIAVSQRNVFEQHGATINYYRAHKMLNSAAYCGRYFGADGMTPPYLTEEEFRRIQGMRRTVVRKSPKNHVFLFSGLAVCAECGRRMGTRRSTRANYQFYACPAPYIMAGECNNRVNMGERKIEQYILDTIQDEIRKRIAQFEKESAHRKENGYKAEITAVRGKLSRLKELYINDLITLDEYKDDRTALVERLNELEALDKPVVVPSSETFTAMLQTEWVDMYLQLGKEDKREIWRTFIRQIRIFPDRHIEFDLNF